MGFNYDPPAFCEGCGTAFPWASREAKIMELENLLEEGGVEESDLDVIHDRLNELRGVGDDPKRERAIWTSVKDRAGAVFMNDRVQNLVVGLANTEARRHMGLPPV
jgi:hypothetical protein